MLFTIDGKRDRPDTSRSPLRETTVTGFAGNGKAKKALRLSVAEGLVEANG